MRSCVRTSWKHEDIDVMRPDVDLRIERLSDRSVPLAGYNGGDKDDTDYRYWFTVTDEMCLQIVP